MKPLIGVCSWSLLAETADTLARRIRDTGLHATQLALDPVRLRAMTVDEVHLHLAAAGITLVSAMMAAVGEDYSTLDSIRATGGLVPDLTWPDNERAAKVNAAIARELHIPLVSLHAGFMPEDPSAPARTMLLERIRRVAAAFREEGVRLALETGQESARTLLDLLDDLEAEDIGVNFDPANMILYGTGDPVAALRLLGTRVLQVHVKDAMPATRAGEWGREAPVGTGAVDWSAFFETLRLVAPDAPLIIEREEGADRVADVRRAVAVISKEIVRATHD